MIKLFGIIIMTTAEHDAMVAEAREKGKRCATDVEAWSAGSARPQGCIAVWTTMAGKYAVVRNAFPVGNPHVTIISVHDTRDEAYAASKALS